jgi:hypothetical protein
MSKYFSRRPGHDRDSKPLIFGDNADLFSGR